MKRPTVHQRNPQTAPPIRTTAPAISRTRLRSGRRVRVSDSGRAAACAAVVGETGVSMESPAGMSGRRNIPYGTIVSTGIFFPSVLGNTPSLLFIHDAIDRLCPRRTDPHPHRPHGAEAVRRKRL